MSDSDNTKKKGGRPRKPKVIDSKEEISNTILDDGSSEIDIPESALEEKAEKQGISVVLEEEMGNSDFDENQDDIDFDFNNDVDIESFNKVPNEDWTPLEEEVIERSYTHGVNTQASPSSTTSIGNNQEIIPEFQFQPPQGGTQTMDFESDFIKQQMMGGDIPMDDSGNSKSSTKKSKSFDDDDIPTQSSSEKKSSGSKSSTSRSSNPVSEDRKSSSPENTPPPPPPNNLQDMSPAEKRKAVKGTADAILLAYRNFVPKALTYISSYDIKKLKKLHAKGELDIDTPVDRQGTTFIEYVSIFNDKVEEAFKFTDSEIEELREPLEDVLMENNVAFTPMQRLAFVLAQQLVGKFMLVIKFVREKNNTIAEMKAMHQERLEILREQSISNRQTYNNNQTNIQNNQGNQSNRNENVDNIKVTNTNSSTDDVPFTETKREEPVNDIPVVTLDSVMNDESQVVENDIPEKNNDEIMVVEAEEIPPSDY